MTCHQAVLSGDKRTPYRLISQSNQTVYRDVTLTAGINEVLQTPLRATTHICTHLLTDTLRDSVRVSRWGGSVPLQRLQVEAPVSVTGSALAAYK